MAVKFWSKEWLDEIKKLTASDQDYLKKAKDLNLESLYILENCPGGVDLRVGEKMDKGVLASYTYEEKPSPAGLVQEPWDEKKYLYRVSGSYETYAKMNRKEFTAMQALSQKIYKIDGPMMRIMSLMGGMTAFTELMATIPVEY